MVIERPSTLGQNGLTFQRTNMIISGGVNIHPMESEIVLSSDVLDVAVIGVTGASRLRVG